MKIGHHFGIIFYTPNSYGVRDGPFEKCILRIVYNLKMNNKFDVTWELCCLHFSK